MRRRAFAPMSAVLALAIACEASVALHAQSPGIRIALSDRAAALRARIESTTQLAIEKYSDWLGPAPFQRAEIGDDDAAGIRIEVPIIDAPGSMRVESQVAEGLALTWFDGVPDPDFRGGAAWYLQSRIVEEMFNRTFLMPGYRRDSICFLGCRVPWAVRSLTLGRVVAAPTRMARVLTTLEREVGWPTLQGALRAVVASGTNPVVAMSNATGRDLSRLLIEGKSTGPIDPSIEAFETSAGACGSPCFRALVVLREHGPQPIPLTLRVTFADGQHVDSQWNGGRDRFEFESATPATSVRLDPDRIWQLDQNPFNNTRVAPTPTNVPVWKWMARWLVWLQDAMLTQTFPV